VYPAKTNYSEGYIKFSLFSSFIMTELENVGAFFMGQLSVLRA
jgi:hypothetical protein